MGVELICRSYDALHDVRRSKRKCKQLENEWYDIKRLVEEKNIECSYQQILHFILGDSEMRGHRKRKREDVIYIDDEEDDCYGEKNDPEYEGFLSRPNEHDRSYLVESEKDGVPIFIEYEAKSGSEDELEQESQRKMMSCAEQILELYDQKPGLVHQQSDVQAQSSNDSSTWCARLLMHLAKRENERGRQSELSTQKPGFRTNRLMQNEHGYEVQALSSRKSNMENSLKSHRKTLVQAHNGLLSRNYHTRINWLTGNECDHDDQARLVEKDKVQSRKKSGEVVKGDHGVEVEAPIEVDKGNLFQKPGQRNKWVTEKLCKHIDPAQPGEKHKVQNQRKSKIVACHTDVVNGDDELSERTVPVVQIDDENQYCRLGPGNNMLVKYQSEHAGQAQIGDKNKVQNPRKKSKVVEGMNLVKVEDEPDKIDLIEIDNVDICQKPGPRNNWAKGNLCELADQAQPGEKEKVHSQIDLQQLVKGKSLVGENGSAIRKAVVRVEYEHLHHKPSQKNNWLTQYQSEHIDLARPVMNYKEKIDRKLKGKNAVKGEHEPNKKTKVQIDNKNFYQEPGPRNNWVTRNYSEHVDLVGPGNRDAVHGQKELMKVVQEDYGLSNRKPVLGNYAVKNEPDDCVKTRLGREGIHNKISSFKAAKCSATYKNSDEDNLEKESHDEIVPEVEILDSAAYIKQGILSPFVPSKRFHKSMMDDGFQDLGRPRLCDEYRKEVVKVLRKPYNKEEYNRHREAIQDGSYLDHYPDLEKSLKRHRHKRGKCLNILRGFFFWLQNVSREGAFQPWKDRQCLAVEPASH